MKATVCRMANEFTAKGYTKSQAFTKAWAIVKAEDISRRQHDLSISTDRYSAAERTKAEALSREYVNLVSRANSIKNAAEIKAENNNKANAERSLFESMGFAWCEQANAWVA